MHDGGSGKGPRAPGRAGAVPLSPRVSPRRTAAGTTPTGSRAPRCRTPPCAPPRRPRRQPAQPGNRTAPTTRLLAPAPLVPVRAPLRVAPPRGPSTCGQIPGSTTAHRVQRETCPSASMWMSPSVPAPSTTVPRVPSGQITRSPLSGRQPSPEESPASAHDSAITSTIFPGMLTPSRYPAYPDALPNRPSHFIRPLRCRLLKTSTGAPLTARGRWTGSSVRPVLADTVNWLARP